MYLPTYRYNREFYNTDDYNNYAKSNASTCANVAPPESTPINSIYCPVNKGTIDLMFTTGKNTPSTNTPSTTPTPCYLSQIIITNLTSPNKTVIITPSTPENTSGIKLINSSQGNTSTITSKTIPTSASAISIYPTSGPTSGPSLSSTTLIISNFLSGHFPISCSAWIPSLNTNTYYLNTGFADSPGPKFDFNDNLDELSISFHSKIFTKLPSVFPGGSFLFARISVLY